MVTRVLDLNQPAAPHRSASHVRTSNQINALGLHPPRLPRPAGRVSILHTLMISMVRGGAGARRVGGRGRGEPGIGHPSPEDLGKEIALSDRLPNLIALSDHSQNLQRSIRHRMDGMGRPMARGATDSALGFELRGCRFESCRASQPPAWRSVAGDT